MAEESRFKLVREGARLWDRAVTQPLQGLAGDVASAATPVVSGGQHLRGAGAPGPGVTSRAATPAVQRPAAAAPAAPAAATPPATPAAPSASPAAALAPGALNTFTGSNGVTRAVDPAPAAPPAPALLRPSTVAAPASTAPQVQQSVGRALADQRGLTQVARADAASILNPMSADAELLRRLENSQGSYFFKGSPSARRMVGEAIAGQLGARNAASAAGQAAGNALLQRGVEGEGAANEGAARRQLEADTFNADDSYRRRALHEELTRPTLQSDVEGNLLSISGTSAAPVTGTDGTQVRLARPTEAGQITPALLLSAFNEQAKAINESLGTPEEKAQQLAALRADPLFAPLLANGQQQGAPAVPRPANVQEFIKAMRERNSKMTDAELTAYYNKTYGK